MEGSFGWKRWTLFAPAKRTENRELVEDEDESHEHPAYKVGKFSLGALYEIPVAKNVKFGIGGLYAFNFVPDAIEHEYGGDPNGAMGFVRLKLD